MNFSPTQTEFPSITQQSVWHAAVMTAPLRETVPPRFAGDEQAFREGQRHLYRFMTELYAELYEHPDRYEIPIGEYEAYMGGRTRRDLSHFHKGDPKESRLRNRFQQSIQFYQKLLFEIGSHGQRVPDSPTDFLVMDESVLFHMIETHNLRLLRGQERRRADHLSRLGLEIKLNDGTMTVSHDRFPHMLTALTSLCRAPVGKFAMTAFLRCDLRALDSVRPGLADAVGILPENFRAMALELDDLMKTVDAKSAVQPLKNTTLFSPWKLAYSQNSKSVCGFNADTDGLDVFIYFNHVSNVSRMGYRLKDESPELYDWFCDRFPTRSCSCPNNRLADIGGCKKRICGLMNRFEARNPDLDDLKKIKRVIELKLDL